MSNFALSPTGLFMVFLAFLVLYITALGAYRRAVEKTHRLAHNGNNAETRRNQNGLVIAAVLFTLCFAMSLGASFMVGRLYQVHQTTPASATP